ncbi:TetR family transcriptional regulator [Herbihabitans rhizosphaerae]|uniref:TetR family transcriptional regulator n=1 Tax=Herbihabitans rhizosphaerae TaxID=1872711 RepID=A0A4Q7KC89_9PSEU|nr:TetR/AcrR family transcriptional regulator [Herbihabitans rhizosphaerae]RZS29458.1 TetR family transcriptional regulator [Herbihabitans rhizosphaerae]
MTASTKHDLVDATVEYATRHGVSDLSLRALASALGTSHRMLIYHFGSKQALLVAVVRRVEEHQQQALAELELEPGASQTEVARRFWQRLTEESMRPLLRLFFELYGQALQGKPGTTAMLDGVIDRWLEPVSTRDPRDRTELRLCLAVIRGLLLDLLTTGDLDAVNAALERFLELLES